MIGLLIGIIALGIILLVAQLVMTRLGVEATFKMLILLLIAVVVIAIWWTRFGGGTLAF